MRPGKCRILVCQPLADGDSFIELSRHDVTVTDILGDDRLQWVKLVSTIHFGNGFLLSTPD